MSSFVVPELSTFIKASGEVVEDSAERKATYFR